MKIERTLSIMLFLCASGISGKAQSPTQNYVMSKNVLDVDGTHAITTVTYYDGLGNPVETATNGLGGTGKYAYTLQEHDALAGKSRTGVLEQRSQVAHSCPLQNCLPLS